MNNENKNTNVGTNNVTSNTTNIPSVGSVPFNGVSPVNQGLSEINTSPVTPQIVSNPTEIPEMTAPTTPQIVNDPTAALKGVDSSTISTTSDAPRITDTAVEATTHNQEQNKHKGFFEFHANITIPFVKFVSLPCRKIKRNKLSKPYFHAKSFCFYC